jgi:hypothetical protein
VPEDEFIERIREHSALQAEAAVKESKKRLTKSKRRLDEVFVLIKKLYENYALDKIPESTFTDLLSDYNAELSSLRLVQKSNVCNQRLTLLPRTA